MWGENVTIEFHLVILYTHNAWRQNRKSHVISGSVDENVYVIDHASVHESDAIGMNTADIRFNADTPIDN